MGWDLGIENGSGGLLMQPELVTNAPPIYEQIQTSARKMHLHLGAHILRLLPTHTLLRTHIHT